MIFVEEKDTVYVMYRHISLRKDAEELLDLLGLKQFVRST